MEENSETALEKYDKQIKRYKILIISQIILLIILIICNIFHLHECDDYREEEHNTGVYSQAEIATFNNQFLKYEGTQKGSVIKSLINETIASNSDENHESAGSMVSVTLGDTKMNPSELTTEGIETKKKYDVELLYSGEGIVNEIIITPIEEEE